MSITERVMTSGHWEITLSRETPGSLLEAIDVEGIAGFGQLMILPGWLDPRDHTDDTLLNLSRWTGVYRGQRGPRGNQGPTLYGASTDILLGDEDGKGDIFEVPRSTSNGYLTQWVPELRPQSLRAGTTYSPGGSYTGSFYLVNAREAFEDLADAFNEPVEWRIRPNLQLDVGTVNALYGTSPSIIIVPEGMGGKDIGLTGLPMSAGWDISLEDYSTRVIYTTEREVGGDTMDAVYSAWWNGTEVQTAKAPVVEEETSTQTIISTASTPESQIPYGRAGDGGPAIWDRLIQAPNDDGDNPSKMAAANLAKFNHPRREVETDSGQYDSGHLAPVGSPVWLYAPPRVMDLSNPMTFRGQEIYPIKTRLMGMTWPLLRGLGIYLRVFRSDTLIYHDLTPYVVWETQRTVKLEIAALPQSATSPKKARRPKPTRK